MELQGRSCISLPLILATWLLVAAAFIGPAECIRRKRQLPGGSEDGKGGGVEQFKYSAAACRAHTASLSDFGGVGDGATSNTAAFQAAVSHLSQFASDGGGMLFVPAGRWLTGPFNLTSSFTLFLHRDAVILATQVISPPTPPPHT
nr:PREDICTED: probable polygalacturonase [Musa acuminata subsp. malaccensis]